MKTTHYELKVLNPSKNKKANRFMLSYNRWNKNSTIWTIYNKPCYDNEKAFCKLRNECKDDNGYDLRCGNQSCHSWSLAYKILSTDGNEYLIYHTRDNVYCISLA